MLKYFLLQIFSEKFYGEVLKRTNPPRPKFPYLLVRGAARNPLAWIFIFSFFFPFFFLKSDKLRF